LLLIVISTAVWVAQNISSRHAIETANNTYSIEIPQMKNKLIRISFDFLIRGFIGDWDNLFQTADVNSGIRMELSREQKTCGIVIGHPEKGLDAIELKEFPEFNKWHRLVLELEGDTVRCQLDGTVVGLKRMEGIFPKFDNIYVGSGFSKSRPFDGKIKNFQLEVLNHQNLLNLVKRALLIAWLLFLGFLIMGLALRIIKLLSDKTQLSTPDPFNIITYFKNNKHLLWGIILLLFFSAAILVAQKIYTRSAIDTGKNTYTIEFPQKKNQLIRISFDFIIRGFIGDWDNLFQTADANSGIRMELSREGKTCGIVIGHPEKGLDAIELKKFPEFNKWHSLVFELEGDTVRCQLDGAVVGLNRMEGICPKFDNIYVGSGFSRNRPFDGDIKNFQLEVLSHNNLLNLLKYFLLIAWLMEMGLLFKKPNGYSCHFHRNLEF
jgi:uncharacterized protein YuzE